MASLLRRLGLSALALTVAGTLAGAVVDTESSGKLRFLLWSLLSRGWNGGDRITIDDATIYYQTFGSGPPVLALHGGLGSLVDMRYQIESLAKNHRVIAPDSRGQGRSTDSVAPLSYMGMAEDMRAVLDRLAISRVDVVGWSDGGIVGLTLALRSPARVGRLVVIGVNFDPSGLVSLPPPEPPVPPTPLYSWTRQTRRTGPYSIARLLICGGHSPTTRLRNSALSAARRW